MSDFAQDFMAKVQGGDEQSKGGVVPNSYVEKKPLDKRWFLIGGLILVLVVVLIVVNVIGFGGGTTRDVMAGTWRCGDSSTIKFDDSGNAKWDSSMGEIAGKHDSRTGKIEFNLGDIVGSLEGGKLVIVDTTGLVLDSGRVSCERSEQ
jgi:hypothetical protein